MPASKRRKIPAASKTKRLLHAFYMVQPILQFLALAFVIGAFSSCSPLSPSAQKNGLNQSEVIVNQAQERAQSIAEDELFLANSKELSNDPVEVVKESSFERDSKMSLRSDVKATDSEVKNFWKNHKNAVRARRTKILTLLLTDEQRVQLWTEGQIRIDLADYARNFLDEQGKKTFFRELKKNNDSLDIGARALLVVPDASFQNEYNEINSEVQVSLSAPSDEKAVLTVSRAEQNDSAALLEAALHDAKLTAIVLE